MKERNTVNDVATSSIPYVANVSFVKGVGKNKNTTHLKLMCYAETTKEAIQFAKKMVKELTIPGEVAKVGAIYRY